MSKISSHYFIKDFKNIFSKLIFICRKINIWIEYKLLIQLYPAQLVQNFDSHSKLTKLSLSKINFELIFSNLFLLSEEVASEIFVVVVDASSGRFLSC